MIDAVSIISFLSYFAIGVIAFVLFLPLWFFGRRLRLVAAIRHWLRGPLTPVFIVEYRTDSASPQARRNP